VKFEVSIVNGQCYRQQWVFEGVAFWSSDISCGVSFHWVRGDAMSRKKGGGGDGGFDDADADDIENNEGMKGGRGRSSICGTGVIVMVVVVVVVALNVMMVNVMVK